MSQQYRKAIVIKGNKEYNNLLLELQSIISKGQYAAYKAVDNIKVQTYWQLGERIVREELKHQDRADYGKYLIQNLASDLGIGNRLLHEIVNFYRTYPIVHAVHAQLSWYHYVCLIGIKSVKERSFYEQQAILYSWSYRKLQKQIRNQFYEKNSPQEIEAIFRAQLSAITPQEVFKDAYNFDFIERKDVQSEKKLEKAIIDNIPQFLKALGEDFAFRGNQVPIKIKGETHFIDLVLGHWGIPCTILVELKLGKFDSCYVGQINKYVAYWRRHRQYAHEKDTIGLLICREADKEEITYILDGLEEKIFIAEYKLKLPSEEKIKKALRQL